MKTWHWAVFRILIGVIFAYAGLSKLLDPVENFRGAIAQYEVLPYSMVSWTALILPWIEFIFGAMMILGYLPQLTAAVLAALCLGFLLVLGASDKLLTMGGKDCGCFGEGSLIHLNMYQVFIMDFVNLLLCLALARKKDHALSLDRILKK